MFKEKLQLAILKEIKTGNKNFTRQKLQFSPTLLSEIIFDLVKNRLIADADFYRDGKYDLSTAELTLIGERYLHDHSDILCDYKGLSSINDWLKIDIKRG
ncbi:hypothetical protein SAMN05443252_105118 [Bacillus sp. OV322]|uniref:hypothetical protein n=1 Tax=Bacillus sp. OV322 TaxID=1882764 RepID=UPI0008E90F71|nr:hypothetical protein [Bacillus sp. OV322]SFC65955.1 hypothetical protein SAMN05443252_105118 [Bacillus sp. OV322]